MASSSGLRILAGRYARALADAAPRDLSASSSALDGWMETSRHSPNLARILSHPRVPKHQRVEIARELFTKLAAPRALVNLVSLLIDKNRLSLLALIRDAVSAEREKREGVCRAVIESASTLPDPLRERVRSRLAEILRRHVTIESRIRPNLLGGVNLRIGSRVWYGSARHKLEQVLR